MIYFNRTYDCKITNLKTGYIKTVTGLRMSFQYQKDTDSESGKGMVTIYNLSDSSRKSLTVKGNKDSTPNLMLELSVGYGNTKRMIIRGKAMGYHMWIPPEAISRFQISDGLFEIAQATIDKSYKKGESYDQVISDLLDSIGLDRGRIDKINKSLSENLVVNKDPKKKLDELGDKLGFRFIVELSRANIILKPKDETSQKDIKATVLLNTSSGLIGKPYIKGDFIIAKCLFNPQIQLNSYVTIDSESLGSPTTNRVIAVKARGDTEGSKWEMDLTLSLQDTLTLMADIYDELDTGATIA